MTSNRGRESTTRPSILLVTGSLAAGGAERVLSEMANYWAKRDWTVVFATWGGPETEDFYVLDPRVRRARLTVTAFGTSVLGRLRSNFHRIFTLRKLLRKLEPDAVLSFINVSNVLTILAAAGLKTKVVVSERVDPSADPTISWPWRLLRRMFYVWSDEIVVQGEDTARWIRRNCWKTPTIIPNPLRPLPELGCDREPLVVAVGRLANQKGFDLLLKAFARIAAEFGEWNVAIVGEGSERANLLRLREKLGLTDRVQFIGQVRDVESWIARAGLVVQPSRFEGFPNALLESMSTGAAVISADCPSGPGEIIQDGVNGRLVPVGDVTALADVMAELMSQPETRKRLGDNAVKVRQRYGQDLIMEQWNACVLTESHSAQNGVQDEG